MNVQGTQLDVLRAIVDIQKITSTEEVEDVQIAEEIDLDINLVRNALDVLAEAGHVRLDKLETLSGVVYTVSHTKQQGKAVLESSHRMILDRLSGLS